MYVFLWKYKIDACFLTYASCVVMHPADIHLLYFQEDGTEMVDKLKLFTPG